MTTTRTQTRTATGNCVGRPRSTGNPVGRPRTSTATGKRVGCPKRDEDYEYESKKTKAARKQPPPAPPAEPVAPASVRPAEPAPRVHFELPPVPVVRPSVPPGNAVIPGPMADNVPAGGVILF